MTATEYRAAYARARRQWPRLTRDAMADIEGVYRSAAERISKILASGALDGKSQLTQETAKQIHDELEQAADDIAKAIREGVPGLVTNGYPYYARADQVFIEDALGDSLGVRVSSQGLTDMFTSVNTQLVALTVNRIGTDGYTLAGRAGRVGDLFKNDIGNVVASGLAQGRDLGKIAADITVYVEKGKQQMVHRWGENIDPDSRALLRRVPAKVDYRALRIVRSELSMSLQEAGKENGRVNPGATGLYDFLLLNSFHAEGDECPELAAGSPYTYETVPAYPHPHCQCAVRPRVKDGSEFADELRAWSAGQPNDRIDAWYRNIYLPAAAA